MKLFLHRGLSFCDVSVVDDTGQDLASHRWLYSKHKFRAQFEAFIKNWISQIQEVILLDEFADRLSGLRLGGSVAAIFPKGLEKLTQKTQSSPIHSETMIFSEPDTWSEEWITETLTALQKDSIKRIAWQVAAPENVLARFSEAGFENFQSENLQSEMLLNWRRNLLNACCSGPVLELTEEIQAILKTLGSEAAVKWLNEDLSIQSEIKNRYGVTSVWTHLLYNWGQALAGKTADIFVMDWDGCFHIGSPAQQRWTPWGWIATQTPLPNVKLLDVQPTTTLEKNDFGDWDWRGKADTFEPGPVFLGRGLKPTVLDLLTSREQLKDQFEVKADFEDKVYRLLSALSAMKNQDQIEQFKNQMRDSVVKKWTQNMLELSQTNRWIILGPLSEILKNDFKKLPGVEMRFMAQMPSMAKLQRVLND